MFDASRLGILVGGLVAATLPALAQELPEAERQKLGERDFVEATEDEHVTTDVGVP